MTMPRLYSELNAEDRKIYDLWLRRTCAFWAAIAVATAAVCTVLALDSSLTPDQQIATYQKSATSP